jgi:transcriptional regulator GlxA family with amidase domain
MNDYLMKNYRDEVNLSSLASLVNMAEGPLCRFFKLNMGLTIFEYLNKIKVEFACKLLMNEELSFTEVCFDSGFNKLSHFNKQFKKSIGAAPSEYRRKFKELK